MDKRTDIDGPDLDISVLGIQEEGQWCAIALEMSLRGYGPTFEDAFEELRDAVLAQLSFALQQRNVDQILFPAEQHYLDMYANAKRADIKNKLERQIASAVKTMAEVTLPTHQGTRAVDLHLTPPLEEAAFKAIA